MKNDLLTYNSPLRFNVIVKLLAARQEMELRVICPQPGTGMKKERSELLHISKKYNINEVAYNTQNNYHDDSND